MLQIIIIPILFAMFTAEEASGISDERKERLAHMFSPILILTEENSTVYDRTVAIRVTKPERVSIISAQSADSIRFKVYNVLDKRVGGVIDWGSFADWDPPPVFSGIDLSQDRFAFSFP